MLLENSLLKVGFAPAVSKGDQCLAVEVSRHLEDGAVVCPVGVVKAILELLRHKVPSVQAEPKGRKYCSKSDNFLFSLADISIFVTQLL